jgi:hypothetical protein
MQERHNRLIMATAAVVTGATLAISGALAAAAAPPPARPAVAGTEHFQFMTTSATASRSPLIARGVFTAPGTATSGSAAVGKFVFAGGTIRIRHSPGKGSQSFNPKTCLLTVSLHGTYKLLSGTGTYTGITGHGTYQLSILAIGARSKGKCSQRKAPVAFQQIIRASGPVRL